MNARSFSLQVDQIWKVGVVGAGQLGSGISLVAASKLPDVNVQIVDTDASKLESCKTMIEKFCDREVRTKKMDEDAK